MPDNEYFKVLVLIVTTSNQLLIRMAIMSTTGWFSKPSDIPADRAFDTFILNYRGPTLTVGSHDKKNVSQQMAVGRVLLGAMEADHLRTTRGCGIQGHIEIVLNLRKVTVHDPKYQRQVTRWRPRGSNRVSRTGKGSVATQQM